MNDQLDLEGKLINRRWKILKLIATGAFGMVFMANDILKKKVVALKIEDNKNNEKLKIEAKIIQLLTKEGRDFLGIPKVHWIGTDSKLTQYTIMVMDMLGPSLESLFTISNKRFSLKTVLMIADNCLHLIEHIHFKNLIHRDIKPENFLLGLEDNSHIIYLIDFGVSQRYKDLKTDLHISLKEINSISGTPRYLSLNGHSKITLSRRDDLESLGYMLIYFLKSYLPWQNLGIKNQKDKFFKIGDIKMNTVIEELCKGLPDEFTIYLNYCRSLSFEEKPDYKFLRDLFKNLFEENNFHKDYEYDWTIYDNINRDIIKKEKIPLYYVKDEEEKYDFEFNNSSSERLKFVGEKNINRLNDKNKEKSIFAKKVNKRPSIFKKMKFTSDNKSFNMKEINGNSHEDIIKNTDEENITLNSDEEKITLNSIVDSNFQKTISLKSREDENIMINKNNK